MQTVFCLALVIKSQWIGCLSSLFQSLTLHFFSSHRCISLQSTCACHGHEHGDWPIVYCNRHWNPVLQSQLQIAGISAITYHRSLASLCLRLQVCVDALGSSWVWHCSCTGNCRSLLTEWASWKLHRNHSHRLWTSLQLQLRSEWVCLACFCKFMSFIHLTFASLWSELHFLLCKLLSYITITLAISKVALWSLSQACGSL